MHLLLTSEHVSGLDSLDSIGITRHWFVDVVSVWSVSCSLLFLCAWISLGQDISSSSDVFLHHLSEEDVVNFDIMCRKSVVQETWWEHHVVSLEPELGTILWVEGLHVSSSTESASGEDHSGTPEVAEQSTIVQWSVSKRSEEPWTDWSHQTIDLEDLHEEPIDHSEWSMESVLTIFSFTHFESLEDSTNKTGSSSKSFINKVLKPLCIS